MPYVLTEKSEISCNLNGKVVAEVTGQSKLKVNGKSVLVKKNILLKKVNGCTQTDSISSKRCTSVKKITKGEATKIKITVNKIPVLLDTFNGETDGAPDNILQASAKQDKLTAI